MPFHRLIYRKRKYHLLSYLAPTICLKRKSRRRYLARVATSLARGRFLDVGCGPGIAAILYGKLSGSLSIGVDIAREIIDVAHREGCRHRSPASFVRAAAERLPFRSAGFETVYLGQILEHLEDLEPALAEADRILRYGGLLVISVPDRDRVPFEGHVRTFDAESLQALFRTRGYEAICLHAYDDRRLVCSGTKSTPTVA